MNTQKHRPVVTVEFMQSSEFLKKPFKTGLKSVPRTSLSNPRLELALAAGGGVRGGQQHVEMLEVVTLRALA